jgi:hypothetical protein
VSYRPITDVWFLARAKLLGGEKYYGAYLGGFPERARALLGVTIQDPVLHVCGGKSRLYPYKGGFGPNDYTLDLDPTLKPDFLQDARQPFPGRPSPLGDTQWPAILMDPPYSEEDAQHYAPGSENYPTPNQLIKNALAALRPGGRVGLIHYILPNPAGMRFVAAVGILCGFNNRIRIYSVFEKPVDGQVEPEDVEESPATVTAAVGRAV